jgi:hypothetical protein
MHEAKAARAAVILYKRGYKKVAVVKGSLPVMRKCGFKIRSQQGYIYYWDNLGEKQIIGQ